MTKIAGHFHRIVLGAAVLQLGLWQGCNIIATFIPDDNSDGEPLHPPQAVIDIDSEAAVVGVAVAFDGTQSTDPDGMIVAYAWDFGDGELSDQAVGEHVYQAAGDFTITLTVTDDDGVTDSVTQSIAVSDPPPTLFALDVAIQPAEAGEVTMDPPGGLYESGTVVTLAAQPAIGFEFVAFDGDAAGTQSTIDVVMDGDRQVSALFALQQVSLVVEVDPPDGGGVQLDPAGGVYAWGTTVTLTASAFSGFVFEAFLNASSAVVSTESTFAIELTEDTQLVARFNSAPPPPPPPPPPTFTLSVQVVPGDGGTVSLDPPGGSYQDGTRVTLTATPNAGYTFVDYSGDASGMEPTLMVVMDADKNVTATFAWSPNLGNPGNLLVTGFLGKNVTEYDRFDGRHLGELVAEGEGGLDFAGGIEIGPTGDVFVVNVGVLSDTSVIRYDDAGAPLGTFITGSGGVGFVTLRFGPNGNLFVPDSSTDSVGEYDGQDGSFIRTFVAAGSGGLDTPLGLTFGPTGNLFVVSKATDSIIEYDGDSGTLVGTVVDLAAFGFSVPVDLAFGPDQALYVTVSGDESVARVDLSSGDASAFVASQSGGLDSPAGLLFHPDTGNLLVVSQGTNSVLEFDGTTGAFLNVFAEGADGDNLFFMTFRPQ